MKDILVVKTPFLQQTGKRRNVFYVQIPQTKSKYLVIVITWATDWYVRRAKTGVSKKFTKARQPARLESGGRST